MKDPAQTNIISPPPGAIGATEFWEYVGGTDLVEAYDSLEAMTRASDLVLAGSVSEVRDGRRIVIPETGETVYTAEILVDVASRIRGVPISEDPSGRVVAEVSYGFSPNPERLATLQASAPIGGRVILFLVNKAADAARRGLPDTPGADQRHYALLRGDQAAIRDQSGTARAGRGVESYPWLAALDGSKFEKVLETIAAVSSTLP